MAEDIKEVANPLIAQAKRLLNEQGYAKLVGLNSESRKQLHLWCESQERLCHVGYVDEKSSHKEVTNYYCSVCKAWREEDVETETVNCCENCGDFSVYCTKCEDPDDDDRLRGTRIWYQDAREDDRYRYRMRRRRSVCLATYSCGRKFNNSILIFIGNPFEPANKALVKSIGMRTRSVRRKMALKNLAVPEKQKHNDLPGKVPGVLPGSDG